MTVFAIHAVDFIAQSSGIRSVSDVLLQYVFVWGEGAKLSRSREDLRR